ncbi:MAG: transglycosylase domain-containing protein [Chitinophagales bacterium]
MEKKRLFIILSISLGMAVLGIGGIFAFYFSVKAGVFGPLPNKKELSKIQNATASVVYSADEVQIGRIFAENRTNARFEDLPKNLVDALIATEDARFYEHEGIDNKSILRVVIKSILLGDRSAGGGSTISQQLSKNLFGRSKFSFMSYPVNKTKEMILAQRIEQLYSKNEILELYLNTVSFSENIYGIETASLRFFSKKPSELQPQESAVLVGMLKANTYYNPRLYPENAQGRRNVVLNQMYRYGYLDEATKDSLQQLPLELNYQKADERNKAPYFMVHVKRKAAEILRENFAEEKMPDIEKDGLRIYTTLNVDLQDYARRAMQKHMQKLQQLFDRHWSQKEPWSEHPLLFEKKLQNSPSYKSLKDRKVPKDSLEILLNKKQPTPVFHPEGDTVLPMSIKDSIAYYLRMLNSGFLALDPQDGAILAWTGGLDFQYFPYDHVLAKRQAASTFKPFVYATALVQGAEPCDYISNEQRFYEAYENWTPRNYDNEYGGFYSMAGAIKKSVNLAAVKTIFETGIDEVLKTARKFGIDSDLPAEPSIALGTGSVSLLEMVKAYAVFANGGYRIDPYMITRIEDPQGNILFEKDTAQREEVLDSNIARLMTAMLQGVVEGGTASKLRNSYGLKNQLAGKTGTAQDYTDGWFIGYNPKIVAGAWVGASSPLIHFRTGTYGSGSAMALPIFAKFFQQLNSNAKLEQYSKANFDELTPELQSKLDCEDYRDKNFFDSVKGLFKRKEGEKVKDKEDKPGFFKRLFRREKE